MPRPASTYRAARRNGAKSAKRSIKNDEALAKAARDQMTFGTGVTYQQPNGVIRYVEPEQWVKL
jgi:hypothetical protein